MERVSSLCVVAVVMGCASSSGDIDGGEPVQPISVTEAAPVSLGSFETKHHRVEVVRQGEAIAFVVHAEGEVERFSATQFEREFRRPRRSRVP